MPTSAPVAGAPDNVWVGPYDAQTIANAIGLGWIAPALAIIDWRVVNVATLCAVPPPAAPAFTTVDAVMMMNTVFGPGIEDKLHAGVDRYLWGIYCEFTDGTPAPTNPDIPPPADMPELPVPSPEDPHAASMYFWLKWLVEQTVPRLYVDGTRIVATGSGSAFVPTRTSGKWETWAAGFRWRVDEKAEFEAHIGDSPNAMWWDLGWITAGTAAGVAAPIRVQREFGTVYGYVQHIDTISWTLPPDVVLSIWPLMPLTAEETG